MAKQWLILWIKGLGLLLLICFTFWLAGIFITHLKAVSGMVFSFLFPFFIAILIAYLLHPAVEWLHRQGAPRMVAIFIIYILFLGLFVWTAVNGVPKFVSQISTFSEKMPEINKAYEDQVNHFYYATSDFPEALHDHFRSVLAAGEKALDRFAVKIINGLKALMASFFEILLIPFLVFYFLKDVDMIKRGFRRLLPDRFEGFTIRLWDDIDEELGSYIRGQLLVCFVLFIISFFALWLMKIPYAVLLSFLIGITDLIPFFGPLIGAAPALFVAATISLKKTVFVGLLILILQTLEGNVISPFIVGRSVHVHPVYVMLSLVIGGQVAGFAGLLAAVPVFLVVRAIFRHSVHALRKKIDNG